jgi:hypothetical protein
MSSQQTNKETNKHNDIGGTKKYHRLQSILIQAPKGTIWRTLMEHVNRNPSW